MPGASHFPGWFCYHAGTIVGLHPRWWDIGDCAGCFTLSRMGLTFGAGDVSAGVQAVCAMLGLIVAVVTLLILIFYARDTKRLADVAVRQAEEGSIPYLTVVWKKEERQVLAFGSEFLPTGLQTTHPQYLYIANEGRGPAISIVLEGEMVTNPGASKPEWQAATENVGDLAVGQSIRMEEWAQFSAYNGGMLKLRYSSLSGLGYESTYQELGHKGPLRTFKKRGFPPRRVRGREVAL
jgi:hypothetical protein